MRALSYHHVTSVIRRKKGSQLPPFSFGFTQTNLKKILRLWKAGSFDPIGFLCPDVRKSPVRLNNEPKLVSNQGPRWVSSLVSSFRRSRRRRRQQQSKKVFGCPWKWTNCGFATLVTLKRGKLSRSFSSDPIYARDCLVRQENSVLSCVCHFFRPLRVGTKARLVKPSFCIFDGSRLFVGEPSDCWLTLFDSCSDFWTKNGQFVNCQNTSD